MKKNLFLLLSLLFAIASFSQKKAVTETGDEVILYEDGTWKYSNDSSRTKSEISVNPKPFKKSDNATFLLKSANTDAGIWIDSKKWSFKKAEINEAAEYQLQLKGKDLYAMIITEKIEVPLETLKAVALENARSAASDAEIVKQEYRTVNDKKILFLQINGTTQGIKFAYYGYYYSNENGTVQVITYTAQKLLNGFKADAEDLLNGFVTTK
ncbi:MAG: hypothetical protein E6H09_17210 [Bacteroidetes bacterium]|nr:MAG: hypothetical protein E6H09_17210 [Bacteroidota bacterium]